MHYTSFQLDWVERPKLNNFNSQHFIQKFTEINLKGVKTAIDFNYKVNNSELLVLIWQFY